MHGLNKDNPSFKKEATPRHFFLNCGMREIFFKAFNIKYVLSLLDEKIKSK
jgi:hypothetical protein